MATGGRPAKSGARGPVVRRVLGAEVGVSPAEVDQAREFMELLRMESCLPRVEGFREII